MKKFSIVWLILIQWVMALEWLHAGWGKWSSPVFKENLAATLQVFTSKNPYPFYVNFLQKVAIPNIDLFANATRIGEMGVALAFIISGVMILKQKRLQTPYLWVLIVACFAAALMNLNFFLASGWMSPSSFGVNLIMAIIELILGLFYIINRQGISVSDDI